MIEEKRSATHEASHAVLAKLFEDYLELDYVTISPEEITQANPDSAGTYGLANIKPKVQDLSCIGFVLLAGIIGEKVLDDGRDKVVEAKGAILSAPEKVSSILGWGDLDYFSKANAVFGWKYGAGDHDFRKACFGFLVDFLGDEQVWNIVEELANAIMKKENRTLKTEELRNFFQHSGFNEFLKDNKEKLIKETQGNVDPNSGDEILKELGISDNPVDLFSNKMDCTSKPFDDK